MNPSEAYLLVLTAARRLVAAHPDAPARAIRYTIDNRNALLDALAIVEAERPLAVGDIVEYDTKGQSPLGFNLYPDGSKGVVKRIEIEKVRDVQALIAYVRMESGEQSRITGRLGPGLYWRRIGRKEG